MFVNKTFLTKNSSQYVLYMYVPNFINFLNIKTIKTTLLASLGSNLVINENKTTYLNDYIFCLSWVVFQDGFHCKYLSVSKSTGFMKLSFSLFFLHTETLPLEVLVEKS